MNISNMELDLIAQDHIDLMRIFRGIKSGAGDVSLGILPYFAFVAEESHKYLSNSSFVLNSDLDGPLFGNYSSSVKKIRARIKLFDDNKGGLDALIDLFSVIYDKSFEWFMNSHKHGIKALFAKKIQPDLGIFWSGTLPVVSTHSAVMLFGLTDKEIAAITPDNMVKALRGHCLNWGIAVGDYIAKLALVLNNNGKSVNVDLSPWKPDGIDLTHTDHYGSRAYSLISKNLGLTDLRFSPALLFLASQINYVERMLPCFLDRKSNLLLRFRFLTAYHATSALSELIDRKMISGDFSYKIKQVLNTSESYFFKEMRELRNVFGHYAFCDAARFVESQDPIRDIVQGLTGNSVDSLSEICSVQLLNISVTFESTVSKTALKSTRALFGDNT